VVQIGLNVAEVGNVGRVSVVCGIPGTVVAFGTEVPGFVSTLASSVRVIRRVMNPWRESFIAKVILMYAIVLMLPRGY